MILFGGRNNKSKCDVSLIMTLHQYDAGVAMKH